MSKPKKPAKEEKGLKTPADKRDSSEGFPYKSISGLDWIYKPVDINPSSWRKLGTTIRSLSDFRSAFPTQSIEERRLSDEINKLKNELQKRSAEHQKEQKESEKWKRVSAETVRLAIELGNKEQLNFVLDRIGEEPRQLLLSSKSFQDKFLNERACYSYVMSIDIRRSTELMLKARTPELYANFISGLCMKLSGTIINNHGVYDKFTGDGILAFFPDFYTGLDAGYYALASAYEAHKIFKEFYYENRKCFIAVLRDVGLGIGIDAGQTHLVKLGGGLTVVGTPVVYACRMAGAPAGMTYLNEPAYEEIKDKYNPCCTIEETYIDVKHEGSCVAYSVTLNKNEYQPLPPAWRNFQEPNSDADAPAENSLGAK